MDDEILALYEDTNNNTNNNTNDKNEDTYTIDAYDKIEIIDNNLTLEQVKTLEEQYYKSTDDLDIPDIGELNLGDPNLGQFDDKQSCSSSEMESNLGEPIIEEKKQLKVDIGRHVRINNNVMKKIYDDSPTSSVSVSDKLEKPNFDKINRINVAIKSLRNQLRNTTDIEKLTQIAGSIATLEHQAVVEKSQGYKQLEKQRKHIEDKIDNMKRQLKNAEYELQRVDNSLYNKVSGYRKLLQMRINMLHEEYAQI